MWAYLRHGRLRRVMFRRQHPIGPYVADFCSPRHRLIIELDGSQHLNQHERDGERTAYLDAQGYRVLRFWNNDVMNNIQAVLAAILEALHLEE